jgi:hypothetical protein
MKLKNKTVIFRSNNKLYPLEKSGIKPNTVRILTSIESQKLIHTQPKHIRIDCEADSFTRKIIDITNITAIFRDYIQSDMVYVISWEHNKDD